MFKKSLQSLFCILPQPAFYSQSAVCILHSVCILPPVRSLQSAVRSLRFTLTGFNVSQDKIPNLMVFLVKYHSEMKCFFVQ